jgi:protein arginine kinase
MDSPHKTHPYLHNENPWDTNANAIWLGSTVVLTRNLEKFNFPGKLPTDKRKQIISLLQRDLLTSKYLKNPELILAENMLPIEKEFLVEHFLSNQSFHQAHIGEGFVLDETGEFLAILNLGDHLILQSIDVREELETTWDRLIKIELEINQSINFAFSPRFGFLTSDSTQCGTGLLAYIFLHLPALLHTDELSNSLKKFKDEGIVQTGLQGNPNEIIGDIVVFHNQYTLGLTDENILSSLRVLATKLVIEEKSSRKQLKQASETKLAEIKDKISRAYAILLHSYQIESIEALHALSLLKLGLDLEWLQGTTHTVLNQLLFECRRAHLICHYGKQINQDELTHRRAEFIHQKLQGLNLLI